MSTMRNRSLSFSRKPDDKHRAHSSDKYASRRIGRIVSVLQAIHGSPDHGNKADALDELIYIVLSQMTTIKSCGRVFDRLKRVAGEWASLSRMPIQELKSVINDAGLSHQKSRHIKAIIRRIAADFGTTDLSPLCCMSDVDALKYLTSLPGVGVKTAKCVLLFSLRRSVLPVDTHVARVGRRLGLINADVPKCRFHDALEDAITPRNRYSFHVNAIAHGQRVCLARNPRCHACPLRRQCPSFLDPR